MSYKQLIVGQRYQNEAYLREGFIYREIGKHLSVSHSTISREVKRNRIRNSHYLPEVAQAKTLKRCCLAAKYRISELTITLVDFGLNEKWSPEQIAGMVKPSVITSVTNRFTATSSVINYAAVNCINSYVRATEDTVKVAARGL